LASCNSDHNIYEVLNATEDYCLFSAGYKHKFVCNELRDNCSHAVANSNEGVAGAKLRTNSCL